MIEEESTPADDSGSYEVGGLIETNGSSADEPERVSIPENWKDTLPEDIRDEPSLARIKDVPSLAQSYLNAQKLVGADKVALPKEGDEEGWDALYDRLGRPESADGYDISVPKGQQRNEAFETHMRGLFHEAGLTKAQASKLVNGFNGFTSQAGQAAEQGRIKEAQEEEATLSQEWGNSYENRMELARRAALKFGDETTINNLESAVGRAAVYKMLAKIGEAMSEDSLNGEGGNRFALTPSQARAEYEQKKLDKEWLGALQDSNNPGHQAAVMERRRFFNAMNGD